MASNNHLGSSSSHNLLLHIDSNAPLQENDSGEEQATRESECGSNLSEILSHEKCHDDETMRTAHCAEQKGKRLVECTREQRWNTLVGVAVDAHERECESEKVAEEREEDEEEETVVIKKEAKKKKKRSMRVNNIDDNEEVFEVPI